MRPNLANELLAGRTGFAAHRVGSGKGIFSPRPALDLLSDGRGRVATATDGTAAELGEPDGNTGPGLMRPCSIQDASNENVNLQDVSPEALLEEIVPSRPEAREALGLSAISSSCPSGAAASLEPMTMNFLVGVAGKWSMMPMSPSWSVAVLNSSPSKLKTLARRLWREVLRR